MREPDCFHQVSTIARMEAAHLDGIVDISQLMTWGRWGIGTLEAIDGESIYIDGHGWEGHADGSVSPIDPSSTTPYAMVADLTGDALPLSLTHCRGFEAVVEELDRFRGEQCPGAGPWWLVALHGRFPSVSLRNRPRQERPWPTVAEVDAQGVPWDHVDQEGWLVGIRFPGGYPHLNPEGWHLHFCSDDRSVAGHVTDLTLDAAEGRIQGYADLHLHVPEA